MDDNAAMMPYSELRPRFGPALTPAQAIEGTPGCGAESYSPPELAAIRAMAYYSRDYLTAKHPDLGRTGAVCPFTAGALDRDLLHITAYRLEATDEVDLLDALAAVQRSLIEAGRGDGDRARIFRSMIVTFPFIAETDAPELIQKVQKELKPDYLREGLMIGEFYPECSAPGVHNADFRPLQSPVTSIAIRYMTPQDAPFMLQDARHRELYESYFGDEGRRRIQNLLDARTACPVTQIAGTDRALIRSYNSNTD